MMTNNNNQSGHRDFDREYGLEQLLPLSVLEDLCGQLQEIAPISVLVALPDGIPYYTGGSPPPGVEAALARIVNRQSIDSIKEFKSEWGQAAVFPIIHELETIGYLVLAHKRDADPPLFPIIPFGNFILKVLRQLIIHNYKNLMFSRLHGQVVEESYAELKQKAALLKQSEQKYRLLAESLEIEVEKKSKEIKETHAHLLEQEKMASIGQLAAGVAHEINNPMGFISSNLNAIEGYEEDCKSLIDQYRAVFSGLDEAMATEEGRASVLKRLERIAQLEKEVDIDFIMEDIPNLIKESQEGAERIKEIVINLKDFAHPGQKKVEYVDINRNLDSTLNIVWNELKYKATVVKEYGELPSVRCFAQQINQVFMNLLVNAAQAIETKGEIRIATRAMDGQVEIVISDTGSGIPKENLSRIFDPFFTTKAVGSGTGLGLNVVYNIIKKHNGTIDVESAIGRGTTFRIRIPVG